jgi:hypothetical protein
VDGSGDSKPGKVWVRQACSKKATLEEYGYIRAWNDDSRGAYRLIAPATFSPDLDFTLQVVTGRKPFEHTNPDAAVIQKVLSGIRPEKPSVGFSEDLWAMLAKTWLEEFEASDSPSARPNIADILELLQEEVDNWSQTSRPMDLPSAIERGPSGTSAASPEIPRDLPDIAGASSTDSYGFPDQLVGHTGLFPTRV